MTDELRELEKDHTGDIEDIATRFGRLSLEPAISASLVVSERDCFLEEVCFFCTVDN